MNESDIHDIVELNQLAEELKTKHQALAEAEKKMTDLSCELLQAKCAFNILKDSKKDLEELIRIRKLGATLKPR